MMKLSCKSISILIQPNVKDDTNHHERTAKIAQDGPAAEHINKTKEFMLKKHTEQMKENGYWLNILNQYYWYKADMDSNFQQVVESITPEDVKQFAKALLEQNNCIEVSMTSGETK